MKPIGLVTRVQTQLADGRKCTPCYTKWFFHGNVFFFKRPSTFRNKWFFHSPVCLQILGFHFTKHIGIITWGLNDRTYIFKNWKFMKLEDYAKKYQRGI